MKVYLHIYYHLNGSQFNALVFMRDLFNNFLNKIFSSKLLLELNERLNRFVFVMSLNRTIRIAYQTRLTETIA